MTGRLQRGDGGPDTGAGRLGHVGGGRPVAGAPPDVGGLDPAGGQEGAGRGQPLDLGEGVEQPGGVGAAEPLGLEVGEGRAELVGDPGEPVEEHGPTVADGCDAERRWVRTRGGTRGRLPSGPGRRPPGRVPARRERNLRHDPPPHLDPRGRGRLRPGAGRLRELVGELDHHDAAPASLHDHLEHTGHDRDHRRPFGRRHVGHRADDHRAPRVTADPAGGQGPDRGDRRRGQAGGQADRPVRGRGLLVQADLRLVVEPQPAVPVPARRAT